MRLRKPALAIGMCAALAIGAAAGALATEAPPQTTPEGLVLQKSTKSRIVYLKSGATFTQYNRVAILDPLVEFEKDWQKDYNNSHRGFEGRVSDKDIERMKAGLAAEFKKVFTKELQDKGGYQVVDTAAPDVLVLRPALLNVEVNAPDLMTAGVNATVVRSAGQMTLFLELWDSETNTLLARIMDAEADMDSFAKQANRVTNVQAADRILGDWASDLRVRLDEIKGKTSK
ncbi:MAG: DUF3313 family protein [Proteobacteria bacterium]|nr:DUF3313 family protein [Pseudomonadota bacterium]